MHLCKICKNSVSDGINLSDSGMLHESCLGSIQREAEHVKNEIHVLQEKLNGFRHEIERRQGFGFKIVSIFSKPEVDTLEIESEIPVIEENIVQLSTSLVSLQAIVTPIYDSFLTYPPDWGERRNQVADRDGERCSKCGDWRNLHLHHIKPLSKGGGNKITNLILLCENCH